MREKYSTQIARFDGKNCFVEVLNSAFNIGKVQLNFCQYDEKTKSMTKRLDIYIDVDRMLVLCNDILTGNFAKIVEHAKKTGKFDGRDVNDYTCYFVDMGGISEDRVQKKLTEYQKSYPWVQAGKGISRQFKIQAGQKLPWILRAEYGLGASSETGLIAPVGKPADYINIPMTNESFKMLAMAIQTHYTAYLNQYYSKFSSELFPNDKCKVYKPTTNS